MDMGGDDLPKGGGNWTLNAFKTATINVGPQGMPLTQIVMTQQDITLNVGPEGIFAKIVMNMTGITLSYGPGGAVAQIMIGPAGINLISVGPITSYRRWSIFLSSPSEQAHPAACRSSEGARMSSRIRFATARNVFEAFPDLRQAAPPPGDESAPLDYARLLLASPRPAQAILFLAYLLPRREAVWWARQCVGEIVGPRGEDVALRAAEAWVRAPDEDNRRAALDIGNAGDQNAATTWLALAAGWSGGSMCAPDLHAAGGADLGLREGGERRHRACGLHGRSARYVQRIKACAEAGVRFAEGGDARPAIARTGATDRERTSSAERERPR